MGVDDGDRLFVVRLGGGADTADGILDGVRRTVGAGSAAAPGEFAVLAPEVPDDLDGVTHVLPVSTGDEAFRLAPGDDYGAYVEGTGARVVAAEVAWAPDTDPDVKKGQALELTRLAAWLHETDRRLLVDVGVVAADVPDGTGDDEAVRRAVQEIRDVGVEADLWAVPLPAGPAAAAALGELVTEAGRDDAGFLVRLVADADRARLRQVVEVAGYRGFVLEPAFWSAAPARGPVGAPDADDVATRLRQAVQEGTPGAA